MTKTSIGVEHETRERFRVLQSNDARECHACGRTEPLTVDEFMNKLLDQWEAKQ